tara:strand:+ start:452 stop:1078 length:627 start_codon:yes stop_codon:yes gene_type:complete
MPFIGVQPASALLTSADIQDGQITTAKVADDAVTGAKIENNPTIAGTLNASAGLTTPSGHVIQTVSFGTNAEVSFNNTSFIATNTTVNITPKFSSSKILLFITAPMYVGNEGNHGIATVYRETGTASAGSAISGTNLTGTWGFGSIHVDTTSNVGSYVASNICGAVLDSPSTTSQLRYTVAVRTYASSASWFAVNNARGSIVAQEIAQ